MIDKVVICGTRRGNVLIPVGELKQSVGRAGRSYYRSGEAIILANEVDYDYACQALEEQVPSVQSSMHNVGELAFHILPYINQIENEDDFKSWYRRSLAYTQGVKADWGELIKYLTDMEMVADGNLTKLGNVSVSKYFSPDRVVLMRDKMLEANANGNATETPVLAWMLSSHHIPIADADSHKLSDYKGVAQSLGAYFQRGELAHGYVYYCIFNKLRPKWLKYQINAALEDLPRLISACSMIADIEQVPIQDKLNELLISSTKNIPVELAKIVGIFNLERKASAYELYDLGIHTPDELVGNEEFVWGNSSDELKRELLTLGYMERIMVEATRNQLRSD